jgi:hypothetical protein
MLDTTWVKVVEPTPLRLAIGSHKAGTGQGCAMNVISWENGDSTITDMPNCADRMLARIVQRVNDTYCRHVVGGLLCPACWVEVLALAHRTVGTALVLPGDGLRRVWVGIAADQARSVLHLARDRVLAESRIVAAEVYANGGPKPAAAAYADAAAAAYADAAAAAAAAAAAYADAAADAAAAAYAARMRHAHRAIDVFKRLTGLDEHTPDPDITRTAITRMLTVA